jgi:integrase
MPKLAKRFTDVEIRNLKLTFPKKKAVGNGLYIAPKKVGGKYWVFRYTRINGEETSISFGDYPEVTLADAEFKTLEANKLLSKGIDPSFAKKTSIEEKKGVYANNFEVVAREMIEMHYKHLSQSYKVRSLRRLELYVFPWVGKKPISEVYPKDLMEIFKKLLHANKAPTIKKTREVVNLVFKYALTMGKVTTNPCEAIKGAIKIPKPKHMAAFTEPEDVGQLMRAIDGYKGSYTVVSALKIAPMVFVRPFELRTARWKDIDLKNAEWSYLVSKTKTQHLVPLAKQVIAILKDMKNISGDGEFVFTNGHDPKKAMSEAAINAALKRMGYNTQTEVTGHGFRATARTILHERLDFDRDVIEHQLAHRVPDALGEAYNRTKFIKQRKEMMQVWADYLEKLKDGN